MTPVQLPLPFPHHPIYAAADFLAAPSNEAAMRWLAQSPHWPDHRLSLWGEPGCGKTHLLRLWAARNGAVVYRAPELHGLPRLPESGGVAVDDAAGIADERALLHLLNAAREAALPVLLAARAPPARWTVGLPDLASRLRSVTAVEIRPPEDALLRSLLLRLLSDRQLAVPHALQEWLLVRLPRSPAALREVAARLDQAALAAGGAVTRPVAAAVLAAMDAAGNDDAANGCADDA